MISMSGAHEMGVAPTALTAAARLVLLIALAQRGPALDLPWPGPHRPAGRSHGQVERDNSGFAGSTVPPIKEARRW